MQIDVRTVSIQPLRQAYDHLVNRFGDKPASRYQEASYDIQVTENIHYTPTWDPDQSLYDASISKIVMEDWYALKDARQYYYSPYVLARSKQQDIIEANFKFVESRGLADNLPEDVREMALKLLVPLRHVAWGASQHNTFICGYGYGVTFTQPCIYQAMDNLGIAQYLSRIGLMLGDVSALDVAKKKWLEDTAWQPLRRYVEDCLVVRDPLELFVAQNVVLDGLLYPLVYKRIVDSHLSSRGGSSIALLAQFMPDWFDETSQWVDSVVKIASSESEHNHGVLKQWIEKWGSAAVSAMVPIAEIALGSDAEDAVAEQLAAFKVRIAKNGIAV